jgi:hypothetical protein
MNHKWLALALGAACWALPAQAQMVRAQDPNSVARALRNAGYSATLGTDRVGDPMITSGAGGTTVQIFFYNYTDHRECATVTFHSGCRGVALPPPQSKTIRRSSSAKKFCRVKTPPSHFDAYRRTAFSTASRQVVSRSHCRANRSHALESNKSR